MQARPGFCVMLHAFRRLRVTRAGFGAADRMPISLSSFRLIRYSALTPVF
nr:hypothetical protein HUO10_005460 [Paraburkholderia busanensis]